MSSKFPQLGFLLNAHHTQSTSILFQCTKNVLTTVVLHFITIRGQQQSKMFSKISRSPDFTEISRFHLRFQDLGESGENQKKLEKIGKIYDLRFWISDFNRDFSDRLQDFTPVADPLQ